MTEWVTDLVDSLGWIGVGFLILLENIVPPIPSEVVLPVAGFGAARGELNFFAAWVASTVGALLGAYVLYGLGYWLGYDRLHRLAGKKWFFIIGVSDLERGDRFWDRHGGKIVLLGRCIPLLRSVVSVPAGIDGMPLLRFTIYTTLGSAAWNLALIYAGYRLGNNYDQVEGYVQPISYTVVGLLLVGVGVLAVRKYRNRARRQAPSRPG